MSHAPTQSLVLLHPARTPLPHPDVPAATQALWPRAVRWAVDYIERHLYEPVNVGDVAAAACMSRYHLARTFRSSTGLSPMGYLRQRRIQQAQALLRRGDRKVSQIASDLCFFDQSHFVRSFRQATGCTPRRFAEGCAPPSH